MKRLLFLGVTLVAGLLHGCGSDNSIADAPDGDATGGAADAALIELLASSPQLQSDQTAANTVTITAIVKDGSNAVIEGAPVSFSSTSGSLRVTQSVTDENGLAIADLTNGNDPSNRSITVTVTAGAASAAIVVDVVGTSLSITGPTSLSLNDAAVYTILLEDSGGAGIPGETVTISSSNGNTLSATSLVTGADGDVQVTLTAANGGDDTVTATALGETAQIVVSVAADTFTITDPLEGAEIDLGAAQNITANWTVSGVPQGGQTITFTTTRGTLSAGSAVTDGAGDASVSLSSTNAGPALITATTPTGISTTRNVEFVATVVATVSVQASPTTVSTGEQSEISALVRDSVGNLVKNQVVNFELTDITGGFLSVASAITDSQGRAQTFYTGGNVASSVDGVTVRAYVGDPVAPVAEDSVNLTVAQQELFIVIGTGNDLFEPTTASFAKEWNIIVTDAVGNAVANAPVQVSILSEEYRKGFLSVDQLADPKLWRYDAGGTPLRCFDEDVNRDGILQTAEDANLSGAIEAGNVATVAAVPASAPAEDPCSTAGAGGTSATVTTNGQGLARVCVIYPQDHNLWVVANIEARATVSGTEFASNQSFVLDAKAEDLANTQASPPGVISPFGADLTPDCNVVP
ncbi:MAG: Ig-like domain-containing protein [Chromatiales bacterium]|nr:MAG: Ig-like domain-containing protein [Chromatiales bacterium]